MGKVVGIGIAGNKGSEIQNVNAVEELIPTTTSSIVKFFEDKSGISFNPDIFPAKYLNSGSSRTE